MLTYPIGVQQISQTSLSAGPMLIPVRQADWKFFCFLQSATAFMQTMQSGLASQLGGNQLSLVDGSEEGLLFEFSSDAPNATPRLWYIMGQDQFGNQICEMAGYLIDRMTKPAIGVDQNVGPNDSYPSGAKLQMNFLTMYGYAEFFWSDPSGVVAQKENSAVSTRVGTKPIAK